MDREAFEKVFPVPRDCEWDGIDAYCWPYTRAAHPYNNIWEAWQAAKADSAAQVEAFGKIISKSIQETAVEKEPMFTDTEWEEAKMFGQYEQRENREEVVVFRRIDLCAYVTMLRQCYEEPKP